MPALPRLLQQCQGSSMEAGIFDLTPNLKALALQPVLHLMLTEVSDSLQLRSCCYSKARLLTK
jgi:hypothetical protein